MASQSQEAQAVSAANPLSILPFPRHVTLRGAALRPTPSNFLYVSTNVSVNTRRKCHLLCKQLEQIGFRTTMESSNKLLPTQAIFTPSATIPKWYENERPLRGQAAAREGYRLTVNSEGAMLFGADEQGVQYAGATLRQLLQDGPDIPGLEIEDYPLLPWRVMHLDFKGWAPTSDYLKQVLASFADIKINAVILEYESFYNFPSQPGLASDGALTHHEVEEIELLANDLGITLIPLVPCIGNLSFLLRLPAYAALREHPDYYQQICPVHPESLGVITAMMEDLAAVHHSKLFHIGGDETRLLGANPATDTRAKQLGGRAALYLDHVGKICRYVTAGGRNPLIWDDMFRKMSDEQVKWLPPETILTFWQYEGQGGRATPAILTNLDRYKNLGRRVWGAATRSPTTRYDSFDNIDAWTEAAELGYIEGLITTAWTRDHTLGTMYAPPETAWPGAYYAAERTWGGMKTSSREQFPQRFVTRVFGAKDPGSQSRLWAGFDLLLREHPRRAREFFYHELKHVQRNKGLLGFLEAWTAVGAFKDYVKQFETEVSGNYSNLVAGCADPFHSGRLRWRVLDAKAKVPNIIGNFNQRAMRLTNERQVQEFIESSIAFNLRKLDEMDMLLSAYPLPPTEWQQPVSL
jgi:hypothetical protein